MSRFDSIADKGVAVSRDEVGVLACLACLVAELLELARSPSSSTRYALIVRSPVISSSAAPFKRAGALLQHRERGPEYAT